MCKTEITEGGGGGGKNVPKIDYVICERPLKKTEFIYLIPRGTRYDGHGKPVIPLSCSTREMTGLETASVLLPWGLVKQSRKTRAVVTLLLY